MKQMLKAVSALLPPAEGDLILDLRSLASSTLPSYQ